MANVQHIGINPSQIRMKASRTGSSKDFGVALAGADAMMGVANAALGTSQPTAGAVLSAAFGGISAAGQTMGGGMGMGMGMGGLGSAGMYGSKATAGLDYSGIPGSTGTSVVPGTEGFTQWDMMNSMNQNNLQLLELQALMQSNMQAWNTKSNILNADHRVKTTMIEKLSPR